MAAHPLVPARLLRRSALCGLWLIIPIPLTMLLIAFLSILFQVEASDPVSAWLMLPSLLSAHGTAGALWGRSLAWATGRSDPQRWMAEARATMLVVSLLGMWSAGIAGSAVIGQTVTRLQPAPPLAPLMADSPA
ncbi:MAG: hypothetical protein IT329_15860 [Caldilineaceae bacterium]|nr:hypothetical protein [Caldilineaceae bacterium]